MGNGTAPRSAPAPILDSTAGCTGRPATRSPALPVRCAGFSTLLVAVVFPVEGNLTILQLTWTFITDGDAVSIAAEILQDMDGAPEGG
ncbi:hypothetical protein SBA3_1550012 [Candidatus Sulfopaludibacter sp. SbA3]|nr:hypothetical protein SBA3_1550012 [Candidatus Sulfopaludibacter sp. SbA3]